MEYPTTWLFKRANFIFVVSFVCFFIFNKAIVVLIDNTLVHYALTYVESSIWNDLLFFTLSLIILCFYWPKKTNYYASGNLTAILLLILVSYSYFRLVNSYWWVFEPFRLFPSIKYSDAIALVPILNLTLWIKNWLECDSPPLDKSKNSLFDDSPIEKIEEDELGYRNYSRLIANKINESNFDKAFAIGVNGSWGIGKTSFINLIEKYLKPDKSKNDRIVFVKFNPWNSRKPQSIIQDFFEAFQQAIGPYHSSLARLLAEYSNRLIKIDNSTISNIIHSAVSGITGLESISTMYEEINNSLKRIDKKFIIIIDDIDRSNPKEVAEVLKLIRNTADFHNTFFIVAYDREYVVNALKTLKIYKPNLFLEKIFQIEISLPQFEKDILRSRLVSIIKPFIDVKYHPEIEKAILDHRGVIRDGYYLYDWLTNIRDVTRLANAIILNYTRLQGEVVFEDLLKLEILRLKFPFVYEQLYRQKDSMLDEKMKNNITVFGLKESINLEEMFNDNCLGHSIDKCDVKKIIFLLNNVFSDEFGSINDKLSVIHPNNFPKYFNYELRDKDLSEVDFIRALTLPIEELKGKIDVWVELGHQWTLGRKLSEIIEFGTREYFEKILSIIFYLASKPNNLKQYPFSVIGFDYDDLTRLLSRGRLTKRLYSGKDDEKKMNDFVKTLFSNSESPHIFEADYIRHISSHYGTSPFLSDDELEKIVLNYFRTYCEQANEMDNTFWHLFHSCKRSRHNKAAGTSYTKTEEIVKETKEIFVGFAKKVLDSFLLMIIDPETWKQKTFKVSNFVLEIFETWELFEKFLDEQDESKWKYLSEFKKFFRANKASGFLYMTYDFNTIPIHLRIRQKNVIDGD